MGINNLTPITHFNSNLQTCSQQYGIWQAKRFYPTAYNPAAAVSTLLQSAEPGLNQMHYESGGKN